MPDAGNNMDDIFNLRASFPKEEEKRSYFDAVRRNDIPALEQIIEKWPEAAEKWRTSDGKTALIEHYAHVNSQTISFLLSKGADLSQTDSKGNWTPLIMAGFLGTAKDVEKFLRAGAPVNGEDQSKRTALSMAVYQGNLENVDLLVLCGADPLRKGSWGTKTILDDCKTDEMRDAITNAQARRAAFLAGQKVKPTSTPEPSSPDEDSDEIKLLKRIELRKDGDTPTPKKPGSPLPAKKPWWKFGS